MFGLSGIGIKIAIFLALSGVVTSGIFYVKTLQAELKAGEERQARMSDVINSQKQAMDKITEDVGRMQQTQNTLNKKLQEAETGRRDLEKKFNQSSSGKSRDFGALANKDPSKVEDSVNRGTRDALRCNELITGAPLTDDEAAGKVRNTMCSNLLPAYKAPATTTAPVSQAAPVESKTLTTSSGTKIDTSKIKRAKAK